MTVLSLLVAVSDPACPTLFFIGSLFLALTFLFSRKLFLYSSHFFFSFSGSLLPFSGFAKLSAAVSHFFFCFSHSLSPLLWLFRYSKKEKWCECAHFLFFSLFIAFFFVAFLLSFLSLSLSFPFWVVQKCTLFCLGWLSFSRFCCCLRPSFSPLCDIVALVACILLLFLFSLLSWSWFRVSFSFPCSCLRPSLTFPAFSCQSSRGS